ncbi:hypothetical protein BpHYR1_044234 [Brachionus plicatilis]|uniref:Uncharacterized protein n=1 Tax=Brachionus plicatilis TaxID=10195 RepID=A0A3M7SWN0_BRAPC|nr:hypothetical protein BpHYR1_044234 [Brachionus plicatilis]
MAVIDGLHTKKINSLICQNKFYEKDLLLTFLTKSFKIYRSLNDLGEDFISSYRIKMFTVFR